MSDFRETLYTIDRQGNRKWVYPTELSGYFRNRRRLVALCLLLIYCSLPWIGIHGEQAVLLDIADRKFIFFGVHFNATDTKFLSFFLGGLAISLFFFTSLLGRVWCGWACPETVYLEFVFRPIERFFEGNATRRKKLDESAWNTEKILRKSAKWAVFTIIAWFLASTCLAYFIGRQPLLEMMSQAPWRHWPAFLLTLAMMFLLLFQFGWFREQFCTVVCPYARFQSVLLDDSSLVISYDQKRGEPRGKVKSDDVGDCVNCGLCVRVCPTGIDIRNGLQLECVQCAMCLDACDSVMSKLGREPGLIRYATEKGLHGEKYRLLRPRVILYASILFGIFSGFAYSIHTRQTSEVLIFHSKDHLYTEPSEGRVQNHLDVRLLNKGESKRNYTVEAPNQSDLHLTVPLSPFPVQAGASQVLPIFVDFPKSLLVSGRHKAKFRITADDGFQNELEIELLGPG